MSASPSCRLCDNAYAANTGATKEQDPLGPGKVFKSKEEAYADAESYTTKQDGGKLLQFLFGRSSIPTVSQTENGYSYTLDPILQGATPADGEKKLLVEGAKLLFRRGGNDSKKLLESQAQAAENVLSKHGVSVSTSSAAKEGQIVRSATRESIENAGFKVTQTGRDLNHHTVELPKPITSEIARIWNELFK